jgi:hypothetical protein
MQQFSPSTHDSVTIFLCKSGLFILFNDILGLFYDICDWRDWEKQRKSPLRKAAVQIRNSNAGAPDYKVGFNRSTLKADQASRLSKFTSVF